MWTKLAYLAGRKAARIKLGTEPGTISYAPRRGPTDFATERRDRAWRENDSRVFQTGEESSLGALNKTGTYAQHSGPIGQGSVDATPPERRGQCLRNAIDNAFNANEQIDQSFGPESAATQPHGSKAAAAGTTFGVGASLTQGQGMGAPTPSPFKSPKPPKVRDPRADKPPGMNLQHGISTNVNAADTMSNMAHAQKRLLGTVV